MPARDTNGRAKAVFIFLGTWLVFASLIAYSQVSAIQNHFIFRNALRDFSLILLPNLLPAGLLGFYLAPKISSLGFGRSIKFQVLGSLIWAFIATAWLFLFLFKSEIVGAKSGGISGSRLMLGFIKGLPFFGTGICALLLPCTTAASFFSSLIIKREIPPAGVSA